MTTGAREPDIGDAFGRVLARCWQASAVPGVAYEIIERDDGHITAGDAVRYFTAAEDLSPLDRWACEQARGRILDIGCGAGRHALPLAAMGKDVLGVDPSPGAVEVARHRGVNAVVGAIENLPPDAAGPFDSLLLQGNNLALLASAQHAPLALQRLAALVRPGARLIGSNIDPYDEDPTHRDYHEWNRQRGRLPGQVRMRLRDGGLATPWFDYLLLSQAELRTITAPSPWRLDHVETDGKTYQAVFTLAT